MDRKIAIEEHFALPETLGDSEQYATDGFWTDLRRRLLDLNEERLAEMDRHGIELAILSLNSPGIQAIRNPKEAIRIATLSNDALAQAISKHPDRFKGFAALPMQDPQASIAELTRCVTDFGFKGALVNGFSDVGEAHDVVYYDDPIYLPFWAAVEQLDVPFYLHPRDPHPEREPIYDGHPWFLGSPWAFGVETAMHALRLMGSGLFDHYPKLKIILGHLGEGIPYNIWRVDHRLSKTPRGIPARRKIGDYFRENFYLTTSGHFRTPALIDAIEEQGADRILFSVDYPFENTVDAATWFDSAAISEGHRLKIGRSNAATLFKL